ncbi:MAG: hypothetical protein ACI4UB_05510 [Limosilactobacillus sp.]
MKSRFKIETLLTIGITLILGMLLTAPASADRLNTVNDNSSASSSSAVTPDNSSSVTSDTTKASQNSATRTSSSQKAASTDNPNPTADSASSNNATVSDNDKQATTTVTVAVVNDDQQTNNSTTTTQANNISKAKSVKKITLTTPNSAKRISQQALSQKIALIPQVSKKALVLTGGIASLVWVPTVVVIFNTLI